MDSRNFVSSGTVMIFAIAGILLLKLVLDYSASACNESALMLSEADDFGICSQNTRGELRVIEHEAASGERVPYFFWICTCEDHP